MNESLKVIISAEIGKLKENVNNAKKSIKDFVKEGTKDFGAMNDEFQKYGDAAKTGLKVAAGAIVGVTTALLGMTAATSEYRQQMGTLKSSFEAAGGSAETAKNTYNDLYRVLGDSGQATEAAQHLGKLTTEEKALSEWTNICQGVYAQFSDSLAIEGLTEAVNHTAKLGEVQGTLADALEWSGVNVDTFNESLAKYKTEAEREQFIRETLNGLYSESAASYEKNNAAILAQNEANQKMQDSMAKVGEAMAPVNAALTSLGADILAQLTPYITEFAEKHLPSIQEALSGVGEAIGKVITWIADNWELVSTLAAIITGIAVALSVFSTVMGIVNAVMAASPVTWIVLGIVAAVAALVAIIILVIKYWDEIKATTIKVWNAIVDAVKTAIDWIVGFFTKIFNWVKENWQGLLLLLVNPFAGAFKLIYDNCEGFRNTIDNLLKQVKQFFSNLWEGIKKIFSNVGSWFSEKFTQAVNGIKNVFNSITGFFRNVWNSIKSIFTSVGTAIADAISGAVKGAINKVLSFATKTINGFIKAINTAISIINAIPGVNIKKLSTLSVPQLERGGVLKKGQVGLLEGNGTEAVVPLEKNTGWLDEIAKRLNSRTGDGSPIILQVDGKTFAQISVDSINQLTEQTGSLPLKFA